jgi:hypothetical protein
MLLLVGIGFWHARRARNDVATGTQPVGAQV